PAMCRSPLSIPFERNETLCFHRLRWPVAMKRGYVVCGIPGEMKAVRTEWSGCMSAVTTANCVATLCNVHWGLATLRRSVGRANASRKRRKSCLGNPLMALIRPPTWLRWSNTRQAWQERLGSAGAVAGAIALFYCTDSAPRWLLLVGWAALALMLA